MTYTHVDISVLMSVYQADNARHLFSALESVFDQTLRPKEVILVKDGPLGSELEEVIKQWQEKAPQTLKTVELFTNIGLAAALNVGLKHCSCELVSRMDSDDVARCDLLRKQADFMISRPDTDVVGTYIEERCEETRETLGVRKVPLTHEDIVRKARWRCPVNHMTVMFKKKSVLAVNGYPEHLIKLQDYALWAKMILNGCRFANIPEAMVIVRAGEGFINRRRGRVYNTNEFMLFNYMRKIGFLSTFEFIIGLTIRFAVRILPAGICYSIYSRVLRNKPEGGL
jgi:glycosyltransferase involved in cell wall biosynthesis